MYAKGITKIFNDEGVRDLNELRAFCMRSDISCFSFNGDIYVKTTGENVSHVYKKTPFRIEDFEV